MGSSDAGLVLDLAQNSFSFSFFFLNHIFLLHYFPSLHPILQSQGFLSIALGGYGSCIFILRNLSFLHQSCSRSFLFSACFHTSLWLRSTCTVLLLQSVSVSAVTLWSPSWSEMEYGLPFSPHQAQSTSQSTVCLLLLLYFHTHSLLTSFVWCLSSADQQREPVSWHCSIFFPCSFKKKITRANSLKQAGPVP